MCIQHSQETQSTITYKTSRTHMSIAYICVDLISDFPMVRLLWTILVLKFETKLNCLKRDI